MSQKPKVTAKPADTDLRPITEPSDARAVNTGAEAGAAAGAIVAPAEPDGNPAVPEAAPAPVAKPEAKAAETVAAAVETPVEVVTKAVSEAAPAVAEPVAGVNPEPASKSVSAHALTRTAEPAATPPTNANPVAGFAAFSQANLEALLKSGQIWSAGIHDLTQQIAATAKESFDETVAAFNAVGRAKSLHAAIELQTRFTTTAIATALKGTQQIAGASIRLTEEALAPLTDHVRSAVKSGNKVP
jgi:phasin family protein